MFVNAVEEWIAENFATFLSAVTAGFTLFEARLVAPTCDQLSAASVWDGVGAFECNFKGYAPVEFDTDSLILPPVAVGDGVRRDSFPSFHFAYDSGGAGDNTLKTAGYLAITYTGVGVPTTLLALHKLTAQKLFDRDGETLDVTWRPRFSSDPTSEPAW
jgi:hypothetical protein